MEIEMIRIVGSLAMSTLMFVLISHYARLPKKKKNREEPADTVSQDKPEHPKVAAMHEANRQSMAISAAALEAQCQMAEAAAQNCEDFATKRHPQSDPEYQRAEFGGDDWI